MANNMDFGSGQEHTALGTLLKVPILSSIIIEVSCNPQTHNKISKTSK